MTNKKGNDNGNGSGNDNGSGKSNGNGKSDDEIICEPLDDPGH